VRQYRERGWVIAVGHTHSRGGADKLARMLGITFENCFDPIIEEGDAKNFDQTVLEFFTNLYYSTMQIHEKESDPDFLLKRKITKWLLSKMIMRLTRLFGDFWGWVRGGVPSGCWNTSHMDSWIMAMYFCLFGLHTIMNAPEEMQEELEDAFFNAIRAVFYGDDHLWNKGKGLAAQYFSADQFARFCERYFGVIIRDIVTGATFCSDVVNGELSRKGCTMLKHQFILNPCKDEGQSTFLPFREWKEFLIRAVWGRETKNRDGLDVMMSCVGHAYGTYASNPDAYLRLRLLFECLVRELKIDPNQAIIESFRKFEVTDLKKLRQLGVSVDELLTGFPSWEKLVEKNKLDWAYLDNIVSNIDAGLDSTTLDW